MASLLIQHVWDTAQRRGEEVAVAEVCQGRVLRSLTWRALHSAAAAWAQRLAGSSPSPVVLLAAPNCLEYMVVFLGTMLADATLFSVSPAAGEHEFRRAISESGASLAVGSEAALGPVRDLIELVTLDRVPLDGDDATAQHLAKSHEGLGSLLLYSSGTTGMPKIIRRDAAALDAVGVNCRDAVGMSEADRLLAAIPVCHSYAIDHAIMAAMIAGTSVDLAARFEPQDLLTTAAKRQITLLPGVPFMFDMLAQCESPHKPAWRSVYSAGGPLPRAVCDAFRNRFGIEIGQIYGTSEFASVTWNDPHDPGIDPQSAGRPMRGVQIRILDRECPLIDHPLPARTEGHVAVAAASMLSGYVGAGEPEARCGDFFLSGDLGHLDESGRLHLTGRLKLLIDVAGQKVNPLEVEAAIKDHPDVADAVVMAVVVTQTVNRVKAVIVWRAGEGDLEALRHFVRTRLSPYKVPRYFESRPSLPRSPTGKVLRHLVVNS